MDELAELYREDEVSLSRQFVWMQLLLERTDTISTPEKVKIQEALKMYDNLWNEHPRVQKILAESAESKKKGLEQGLAQGLAEGALQNSRKMFINIVKARFPALTELAQQEAANITSPDALDILAQKVATAPDENIARWLLSASKS